MNKNKSILTKYILVSEFQEGEHFPGHKFTKHQRFTGVLVTDRGATYSHHRTDNFSNWYQ